MSARLHTAVLYRLTIPAWLLAAMLAAVLAAGAAALALTTDDPVAQAGSTASPAPHSCLSSVVGHC